MVGSSELGTPGERSVHPPPGFLPLAVFMFPSHHLGHHHDSAQAQWVSE